MLQIQKLMYLQTTYIFASNPWFNLIVSQNFEEKCDAHRWLGHCLVLLKKCEIKVNLNPKFLQNRKMYVSWNMRTIKPRD